MKKLLLLSFIIFSLSSAFAQAPMPVASGTITNTAYSYIGYTLGTGIAGKVNYQLVATRTSGTTTGGLQIQQSNNGTSWTTVASSDTLAITNTASEQSKQFTIDIPAAKFIRVRGQLVGTGVYAFKLYANYRYNSKP